jgi:lactate dehydrogenase-like 2-hydroxyacid dehydrogenase
MLTDRVDRDVLAAAPRLRALANYAVGTDNIDLAAATERGIPVGNTPDVLTGSTADLAVALMLGVMRRLPEADRVVRDGEWRTWEPAALLGHDLHRSTVLVVGNGRIGSAVARRVEGFGAEVTTAGRDAELEPLLGRADVVTLHTPLTDRTRGLIGEDALRAMKPTAVLVNTARGPVVDTPALERALREGWIAGAALDVTDPEPLPADHPLLGAPNLLVVPHIASATHHTRGAMADMAVDNLLRALEGERMPWCANPEVYGR